MPLKLQKPAAKTKLTVTKTVKNPEMGDDSQEELVNEEPEVVIPNDEPTAEQLCSVGFKVGMTKPTDTQYESVRFEVFISIPCAPGDVDETFDFAKEWAQDKLNIVITETFGE